MIVFDTETTGLPGAETLPLAKQPKIIEIAAIKLDDETLEETDRFTTLINPQQRLEEIIVKITGLTDKDLHKADPFGFHYEALAEFFLGERHLIAHNLAFDSTLLRFDLDRIGKLLKFPWPPNWICTVDATRHVKGFRLNMAKLYAHCFDGATFKDAHRAEADTEALANCVRRLIEEGTIKLK
jgi:DNA polymerase III subunit epsilon